MIPFKPDEIGTWKHIKGQCVLFSCGNPFAFYGIGNSLENLKSAMDIPVDIDENCFIVSDRSFIAPSKDSRVKFTHLIPSTK